MPYLTPPTTSRKKRGVFEKYKHPTYYEDIYGDMNEDELFDRYPDRCESESEDDDEPDTSPPPRLLGSRKRKREMQDFGNDDEGGTALFVSEDEREDDDDGEVRYKIAPRINPKSSIRLPSTPKTKPKKFGMFGGQDYAKKADTAAGRVEISLVAGDGPEGPPKKQAKENVKRIKRPAGRKLLKQQLADQDKARKEALRAERARAKADKKTKGAAKGKTPKASKKLYWNDVRVTAKDVNQFEKEKLLVFIDDDSIDPSEDGRYDD